MDNVENNEADENKQSNIADSIPSSSTDADVIPKNAELTNEDAISSTSAEPEPAKVPYGDVNQFSDKLNTRDINLIIMSQPSLDSKEKTSPLGTDADFLALNISDVSTEKITEDVEDIVQDLENLLGESTDTFTLPPKVESRRSFVDGTAVKEQTSSTSSEAIDPFLMFENELANTDKNVTQCSSSEGNEVVSSNTFADNNVNSTNIVDEKPAIESTPSDQQQFMEDSPEVTSDLSASPPVKCLEITNDVPASPEKCTEEATSHLPAPLPEKCAETANDLPALPDKSNEGGLGESATVSQSESESVVEESKIVTAEETMEVESVVEESKKVTEEENMEVEDVITENENLDEDERMDESPSVADVMVDCSESAVGSSLSSEKLEAEPVKPVIVEESIENALSVRNTQQQDEFCDAQNELSNKNDIAKDNDVFNEKICENADVMAEVEENEKLTPSETTATLEVEQENVSASEDRIDESENSVPTETPLHKIDVIDEHAQELPDVDVSGKDSTNDNENVNAERIFPSEVSQFNEACAVKEDVNAGPAFANADVICDVKENVEEEPIFASTVSPSSEACDGIKENADTGPIFTNEVSPLGEACLIEENASAESIFPNEVSPLQDACAISESEMIADANLEADESNSLNVQCSSTDADLEATINQNLEEISVQNLLGSNAEMEGVVENMAFAEGFGGKVNEEEEGSNLSEIIPTVEPEQSTTEISLDALTAQPAGSEDEKSNLFGNFEGQQSDFSLPSIGGDEMSKQDDAFLDVKSNECLQDKLTLEAVESIANYEFEENIISSSDGIEDYFNSVATDSSLYDVQGENVPVSSSQNNCTESVTTSSINMDMLPESNDAIEEALSNFVPSSATLFEANSGELEADVGEKLEKMDDCEQTLIEKIEPSSKKTAEQAEERKDAVKNKSESHLNISKPLMISVEHNENVADSNLSTEQSEKEDNRASLKMTITKQADSTHSILKIFNPSELNSQFDSSSSVEEEKKVVEHPVPRLKIRPVAKPDSGLEIVPLVPKITIKPIPQSPNSECYYSSSSKVESNVDANNPLKMTIRSPMKTEESHRQNMSPKLTIKPIIKPEPSDLEITRSNSPRITIKPILRSEQAEHSPRLTIKPVLKHVDTKSSDQPHSPRITIKPIVKPEENSEMVHSPKITIKPIVKPEESEPSMPRITIKPVMRSAESMQSSRMTCRPSQQQQQRDPLDISIIEIDDDDEPEERVVSKKVSSPKITIKRVVKPPQPTIETIDLVDYEDEIKQERIVLKINKNSRRRGGGLLRQQDPENEKLEKIKLKFTKGGRAHIIPQERKNARGAVKRPFQGTLTPAPKRMRTSTPRIISGETDQLHTKLKQILNTTFVGPEACDTSADDSDDVVLIEDMKDPLGDIPMFEITPQCMGKIPVSEGHCSTAGIEPSALPPPRKRGRPRKVPLVVREEFKDPKEDTTITAVPLPVLETYDSGRPKRSCRGPSVRTTLGIKPRKPRGPGRGRGGKRGMGTRPVPMKPVKEPKLTAAKLKLLKVIKEEIEEKVEVEPVKEVEITKISNETQDSSDVVVIYEEETRMSADSSSRAQTPAKQVISSSVVDIEESQSSFQSSATTESVKARKGPRLEVHQEPEGSVISAEQLAEYSWGGGGPYMLQEQVAQFLGIKSFKRKYPGIKRRPVDMQERDFIRESGLASEAMCDLGLTAVNSADILDIMYTDFQNKYEEYCKHQRDRQAKDLTNKQKALSLAAKQESNKLDITEQAIQSASTWNSTFNKARREGRKACIDLQTFTVQYPKGRMIQINKPKVGNYPVSLVPGQFTDWYKTYTPTEINNLPLNTMCYDAININNNITHDMDDSHSDCSMSDSDSSSSDSDSSDSGSSATEDCNVCSSTPVRKAITA